MDPAREFSEAPATVRLGLAWATLLIWWHAPSLQSSRRYVEQSLCVSQDVQMLVSSCREVLVAPLCWQEGGWVSAENTVFLLSSGYVFSWSGKEMSLGITKSFKHWGSSFFISVPKP